MIFIANRDRLHLSDLDIIIISAFSTIARVVAGA